MASVSRGSRATRRSAPLQTRAGALAAPVTAVPWPPPCQLQLTLSRRENCTALGKLVDADAYVEYVQANGR